MDAELKPCPFCGCLEVRPHADAAQGDKWGAMRCGCGVSGPEVRTGYDTASDAPWHADAAVEWNRRPIEAERDATITQLRAELERVKGRCEALAKEFGALAAVNGRRDVREAYLNCTAAVRSVVDGAGGEQS